MPFKRPISCRYLPLWFNLVVFIAFWAKPLQAQTANLTSLPSRSSVDRALPSNLSPVSQTPNERANPQPPSVQPQPEPAPPAPLPAPDELLPSPASPTLPEAVPDGAGSTFRVERFVVTGSTVFTPQEFAKVTKPYTQTDISIAELFQARSAVTQLYLDNGYITSGAYIPPQKLQGGVVEIRVIEGGLEDIKISGTRRLKPNYVRSRLAIATEKPLNRNRLLEALQLLQLNPLIQNLSAELSAGSRPGESLLQVTVTEAKTLEGVIVLDNGRSPSVGSFRRQIGAIENNLLGFGDRLSLLYTNTDGSNSGDFSYTVPVNPRNGTIGFNVGISDSRVIEQPFDVLDIDSKSRYYELVFRQPILQTPTQEIALGITATQRSSEATLLNGEIPFPALGADENGKTRLTAVRFFQDATWRSSQQVIALRSQFTVGLNALNATINEEAPDSRFLSWRGQAQWVRLLAPETLFLMRADLQLSDRPILPLEQFALGGQDSVRGYRQDLLLSDNGLLASIEVRIPVLRLPQIGGLLQLTPFFDFGKAWNFGDRADPDPSTLASLGLGLRFQLSDRLTARFDYGIPLISINGERNTWQERGLYFSIVASPF